MAAHVTAQVYVNLGLHASVVVVAKMLRQVVAC